MEFTTSTVLLWAAAAALAIGVIGGIFPLFKSRKLSPASIQRRFYWTGCVVALVLLFFACLPDWRTSIILVAVSGAVIVSTAFFRTSAHQDR